MPILLRGASEHNLKNIDVEFGDGLTVVTGVSGSGKSTLVFDILYHESRRRYLEAFGRSSDAVMLKPAQIREISGLGPAIAVGQNQLNRNPFSTLASASGIHPLLRVLYARFGTRFCPECSTVVLVHSIDQVVNKLFELSRKQSVHIWLPLVNKALGSHRTLMDLLSKNYPSRDILIDGKNRTGQLNPAENHDIHLRIGTLSESYSLRQVREKLNKSKSMGATWLLLEWGKTREQVSFGPVCTGCGRWLAELQPKHFISGGKNELQSDAAEVRWSGMSFQEFLKLPVEAAKKICADCQNRDERILREIIGRLTALSQVGLGYISLNRSSPTLSRGESQRLRLALALTSKLQDMIHILDEPTIGQHPWDVAKLLPVFRALPGPVIFVEHDKNAALFADYAIDLGPGAGEQGGAVVFSGSVPELLKQDSETGRYFSGRKSPLVPGKRCLPKTYMRISGANHRYLRNIDVSIPIGRKTVVTGISGSGKSTLIRDVLYRSLKKGKSLGCEAIEGPPLIPVFVDQSPIGVNPRSNPATYAKLLDTIRQLFASNTDLSPAYFSFNTKEGACKGCGGLGAIEVNMRYLPSTWISCSECGGNRYSEEVLNRRITLNKQSYSIADVLSCTVSEVQELVAASDSLPARSRTTALRILSLLEEVGLGYLRIGQPSPSLSGGEAQRIKLVKYLGKNRLDGTLFFLDEPSTGLHPFDITGLIALLDRLIASGATLVIVEHNIDIIKAADWIIDLGPGSGPKGGSLIHCGTIEDLQNKRNSLTADALSLSEIPFDSRDDSSQRIKPQNQIKIQGARVHNLKNVSVAFPKGRLSVITGVSGSGKSSLVTDVIEAEAKRRFLESLSFYERQSIQEGAEVQVDTVSGLGVTFSLDARKMRHNLRMDVGLLSGLTLHVAALMALAGLRFCHTCKAKLVRTSAGWLCPGCGETLQRDEPRFFIPSTYASACRHCHGVGTRQVPNPKKLIVHPELPLCAGAMYSPGFFPQGYLGKPYNGGYYLVRAFAESYGFDPETTPWEKMSKAAQEGFLFGVPELLTVHYESKKGKKTTNTQQFDGFYGWVRDWDIGGTYTDTQKCPECNGARFRPEFLNVRLAGKTVHELREMPLAELSSALSGLADAKKFKASDPASASLATGLERLRFLLSVGLGYLCLNQLASSLSAGEVQRLRIAGLLGSSMSAMTVVLDEPSRGLHPSEVEGLVDALRALASQGQTVLVIEHEMDVIRAADFIVEVGPGPGKMGGSVVYSGPPAKIGNTATGRWLSYPKNAKTLPTPPRRTATPEKKWLRMEGASGNNLKEVNLALPTGLLTGICGVSGSGKSTLMIDTLGRILSPKKHTTSVAYEEIQPCPYQSISNPPQRCIIVDQAKAGIINPADYMGLESIIRKRYLQSATAESLLLTEADLRRNCSVCRGRGYTRTDLAFLPPLFTPCDVCGETGYTGEALEVYLRGKNLAQFFALTVDEALELWSDDPKIAAPLTCLCDMGLGYLLLRQPNISLSGGEVQRIKIAKELKKKTAGSTLYLLDEPTIGLHMDDVVRFVAIVKNLCGKNRSVAVVEHHPWLLSRCDWLIELGPGGGPKGGSIVAQGTPEEISEGDSPTAPYIREALHMEVHG